jgi:hypothetical protein
VEVKTVEANSKNDYLASNQAYDRCLQRHERENRRLGVAQGMAQIGLCLLSVFCLTFH